jgi:hypothetical protein
MLTYFAGLILAIVSLVVGIIVADNGSVLAAIIILVAGMGAGVVLFLVSLARYGR